MFYNVTNLKYFSIQKDKQQPFCICFWIYIYKIILQILFTFTLNKLALKKNIQTENCIFTEI